MAGKLQAAGKSKNAWSEATARASLHKASIAGCFSCSCFCLQKAVASWKGCCLTTSNSVFPVTNLEDKRSTHLFCCFLSVFHVLPDLSTVSASSLLFQGQAKHLCVVVVPLALVGEWHRFSLPGVLFCCLLPSPLLLLAHGFDVWQQLMEMYFRGRHENEKTWTYVKWGPLSFSLV